MSEVYNHDIANFMDNIQYIEEVNKPYVIIAPSYMIYQIDFNEVLNITRKKNSDVTVIYKSTDNAKEEFIGCDTLSMDKDKRIVAFEKEPRQIQNPQCFPGSVCHDEEAVFGISPQSGQHQLAVLVQGYPG